MIRKLENYNKHNYTKNTISSICYKNRNTKNTLKILNYINLTSEKITMNYYSLRPCADLLVSKKAFVQYR